MAASQTALGVQSPLTRRSEAAEDTLQQPHAREPTSAMKPRPPQLSCLHIDTGFQQETDPAGTRIAQGQAQARSQGSGFAGLVAVQVSLSRVTTGGYSPGGLQDL